VTLREQDPMLDAVLEILAVAADAMEEMAAALRDAGGLLIPDEMPEPQSLRVVEDDG
jgi:hypothetical protein